MPEDEIETDSLLKGGAFWMVAVAGYAVGADGPFFGWWEAGLDVVMVILTMSIAMAMWEQGEDHESDV